MVELAENWLGRLYRYDFTERELVGKIFSIWLGKKKVCWEDG